MNSSGDAAEQVVHLSLEGTEMVLRLSGSAARNVAAAIYTIWKNRDKTKTKGYQRLDAMLKSGKELKVFTITEKHLKQFSAEAKRYGVVYCALRGKERSEDGMVDIMVRAEDASKINRIVERFKLATVDAASIKQDITQTRTEPSTPEPELAAEEQLLDELLGMAAPDIFRSVSMELAHAELGADDGYTRNGTALTAYSVSYLLCRQYGIDARGYDFSRAAEYFKGMDAQTVRAELSKIRDTAADISSRMSRILEPRKVNKSRGQER